jgi:hypothetical protein
MARTCICEHPQSQHKASKYGCRNCDIGCARFEGDEPDAAPQPVDEAARTEQATPDIEATGHLPVIEIQPAEAVAAVLDRGREYAKGGIVLNAGGDLGRAALDAIKAYEQGSGTAWRGEAPATEATSAALRRVEQERDKALADADRCENANIKHMEERDLARAELATARTAYLAQSAELTSARTELASVKAAATRKVTAMLEAHAPAEPPLWQYTVWFCQPATGCGQRYSQDQPDHECGPLTQALVTITRQPEGAPAA